MAAFFSDNSDAMVQLESMVDTVGVRNVLFALERIADLKAEHLATNWQDTATAKVWSKWANRFHHCAASAGIPDPLEPVEQSSRSWRE